MSRIEAARRKEAFKSKKKRTGIVANTLFSTMRAVCKGKGSATSGGKKGQKPSSRGAEEIRDIFWTYEKTRVILKTQILRHTKIYHGERGQCFQTFAPGKVDLKVYEFSVSAKRVSILRRLVFGMRVFYFGGFLGF